MEMSIAALSMNMAQSQVLSQVGIAVMDMTLDTARFQGAETAAALESLPSPSLESSVNPAIGGNFDMSI